MRPLRKLTLVFFRTDAGAEPVREWLRALPRDERAALGEDLAYVQFNWPLGRPRVAHLRGDMWEVRSNLATRTARVLFAIENGKMVLLHGFIKKTSEIPQSELRIAAARWRQWKNETRQ
jgi:phage-related protein